MRSIACRACSAGGRGGSEETEPAAVTAGGLWAASRAPRTARTADGG